MKTHGRAALFCLATLLLAAALSLLAAVPAGAQEKVLVPNDWALKPSGLGVGDEFRLLVVTRTRRNAESSDIGDYNTFVEEDIDSDSSHALIRPHAGRFRAVVSTSTTSARANTGTTGADGPPIYWLSGDKVADNHGDFYDGSWDSETPRTSTGGVAGKTRFSRFTSHLCHLYWTGTDDAGAAAAGGLGSGGTDRLGYLGNDHPGVCGTGDGNPLSGRDTTPQLLFPFYALSPVFKVATTVSLRSAVRGNSYDEGRSQGVPFEIVTSPAATAQHQVKVKVRIRDEDAADLVDEATRTITLSSSPQRGSYTPKTDPLTSADGRVSMEVIDAPDDVLVTGGKLIYTVRNTVSPPRITVSAAAAVLAGVSEGTEVSFSLATDADDGFDGGQDVKVRVIGDPSGLIDPSDRNRTLRATASSGSEAFTLRTLVDPGSGDGTVTIEVLAGDGYEVGAASKIEIPVKNDPDSSGRLLELKDGHTSSAMEGNGLLFEFSLSGTLPPSTSSAQPQVQVSTVPSGRGCTATASAEDYREYSRTKKFIDSKITVIVVTTNDNFHERDETVCLKIHEPRYLVLPGNRKEIHVSGTIRDNDPLPTVSVSSPKASESADTLTFEVTLDKPPHEKDLTVAYSDSGRGTATPGKDHDAIPAGTLTFSRLPIDEEGTRDTRKTVTVPLVDDPEPEGDETVVLRLNKVRNGRLDGGGRNLYGTGTITDDERILPTLTFRNGGRDAAVQEGGKARIRVDLRDGDGKLATLDKDVAFTWSTVAFTAQADDFTAVSKASATLPAGQTGVAVEVQTLDDSTDEAVEYFQVRLDGVAENVKGEVQVSSIGATVPIHDGPTLAVFDAAKRTEGQPLEFHVTLGAAAPADVEVAWKTETATGQTATAGKDYTAASGTLTIAAGRTGGVVRVRTLDDSLDEPDEDLSVVLTAPFPAGVDRDLNYATERERAVGVIRDDDARPRVTMGDVSTTEGGKLAFKAVLDKVSGKPVRLGWATAPSAVNGATFGKDYRGRQAGEITIRPGGKEARIEFVTVDDDLDEPDETFKLRLYDREAVPGLEADAALASRQRASQTQDSVPLLDATGTIVDNDGTTLAISDAKPVNERGGATARFRVTLSHAQAADVTVTVKSEDGNAPVPSGRRTTNAVASTRLVKGDYEAVPARTLTFRPGETVKTVDVTINDDVADRPDFDSVENTETFRMLLSDATGATISRGTAIGTILDGGGIRYSIANQVRLVREGESITVRVRRDRADAASGAIRVCLQSTGTGTGHAVVDAGPGVPAGGEDVHVARRNFEGSLCTVRTESHDVRFIEFKKGQFETSFQVHTIGDALNEGDETFLVTDNSPYLRRSGTDTHLFPKMFTIVDGDFGVLRVEAANSPYEGQQAEFEVYVDDPAMIAAGGENIHVTTGDGTATAGDDYEAQRRKTVSLTRPASADEPAATFAVDTVDDEEFEEDETFSVMLGGLPNGLRLHPVLGTATATIRDEDGNRVHVEDTVVDEGDWAAIRVRMELPVEKTVTVTWKTVAGTAAPVNDFTAVTAGKVRIPPGSTTATVRVATVEDTVREKDESFRVVVTGTNYAEALVGRPGVVVIRDDDAGLTVSGLADASVDEDVSWTSGTPSFEGLAEGDVLWTVEGDDAAKFSIDRGTGQLTLAAQDFEKPADKDKDNIYEAVARVTDEDGNTGSKAVSVAVNDVVRGYVYVNLAKLRTGQGVQPEVTVDQASGRIRAEEGAVLSANFLYGDRGLGSGPRFTYKPRPAGAPEFANVGCKVSGLGGDGAASAGDIAGVGCHWGGRWEASGGFSRGAVEGRLVRDRLAEGTETFSIDLSVKEDDLLFALWTGSTHVLSGRLDIDIVDARGVSVAPSSKALTLRETDDAATEDNTENVASYTVVLDSQPTADVTVAITAPLDAAATADPATLTFTPSDWDEPQTVTVTAVDDDADNAGGQRTATLSHDVSGGDYGGAQDFDVTVTVTDDDTAGLVLAPATLTVAENAAGSYTVALATKPSGAVAVTVTAPAGLEVDGPDAATSFTSGETLAFSTTNWKDPQTVRVRAPDDEVDQGTGRDLDIAHAAAGADYGSVSRNLAVTVTDDDARGVSVAPSSKALTLRETDDAATEDNTENVASYTVVLDSQPTADVTVAITAPLDAAATADPATLTFTPSDWDEPQTVTVTAVDDDADNAGGQRTATLSHDVSGGDYGGAQDFDVTVTVTDDDTAGLVLAPATLTVAENAAGSYTVALATKPSGAVAVTVTAPAGLEVDGPDAATSFTSGETLAFSTTNWKDPQTVRVRAPDDEVDQGTGRDLDIAHAAAGADYGSVSRNLAVTVTDDDARGVSVAPSSKALTLRETDDAATEDNTENVASYTVVLDSQPTADVTVAITAPLDAAATADPATLTFTPSDWDEPQTVTVTAVDDDADNAGGQRTATLSHDVSGGDYGGAQDFDVTVTVTDDDTAGLVLAPATLTVAENAAGSYTVALATKPSGAVAVTVTAPAGLEVDGPDAATSFTSGETLAFSTTNWKDPQTVRVRAPDDEVDQGTGRDLDIAHAAAGADYGSVSRNLAVTVTDDDARGVSVAPSSKALTLRETDDAATEDNTENVASYTVVLDSQPTADVTVAITAPLDAAATADPATLTFTPSDWDEPQTVTVTAVDDDADNAGGQRTATLSHDVSGGDYGGAQDFDVTVTVTDDDTAGLVLAPATLTVAENAAGSYTVALATKPSGAVAVTVTAPAGLEVDGPDAATSFTSGETLAFSTTNWKDPQTVRVRAPDDEVDQGTGRDLDIAHAAAGADYGSVSRNLAVTVTDDDARGVSVAPSSKALTLRETDDAATEDNTENVASYTVVLDSQPTADVTVAITAPLDAAATADPATLTFTPSDWDEPQTVTVTAVDDDADNAGGQRTATLSHDVSGGDYGGAQDFDVTVTVTDDDTAGLVLAPATLTVAENAAGSYTVALATKPSGAVAVTVTAPAGLEVDGPDAATSFTSGETLAFSTTNWKDPQTVRVRAPDDEVDQGTGRDLDIAHAAAGADYGSVSRNLAVTVTDDDARGVSVAPSSKALTLRETDDAATEDNTENVASYTVVLDSQPTADVTVAITAPLDAAATADPATLTFTPSDWDEPQTVTVTAVDDDADNAGGQRTATLSHDVSGGDYGGAQDFDVTVTVTDDDTAGLVLAPATLTVAENAAGSYTVALATKPSGAVAVTVTAPAGLEVDGPDAATSFTSGETLAFSTTNWKDPQTVRVRAPDDEVDQGTGRDLDIAHAAAGADYGSVSRNLAVTVTDDDARGVSVAPSSKALTLRETDDAATEDNTENVASYTVVLDSQPTADVTVAITAPLDAAATADPATLTFTPSDWDEPQTVTVTAVDDDADNAGGQRTATLSHDVSGGDYGGAQDFDVTVTVTDDDTAGLVLAPATLTVAENAAGSYTVALATKPSGAVAVTVTAPAGLEVDGPDAATSFTSGETLAFSTTNWKDPQTVRVRAPDDEVDQGTGRDLDIAHAAAGADYGSVSRNLAVTVTDDDARGVSVAPSSKALTLRETDDAATEDNTENVASYTVVLDSQPTADVTVAITAPLDAAATADPATLTFTPSDWDEPQTVTVTAVDDDADNAGGQRTATLSHDVSGGDYGGAQDFDVTVTVTDDDTAGLVLAPATLTVAENAAGSYTVALATKPSGAVAVTVTAPAGLEVDGPDAATSFTSGETLAFSTTNWKDPQTVRVRAPDDEVDQGTGRDLDIAHAAAGADYGSVSRNLAVTVTDDDARGVSVAPSSKALTLRETDDAATEDNTENVASYTVVLDSQPTADVTVAITAPLDAAATADPATLTFTPSDWDEPQTVTVTAVDDDADNAGGQRTATLSHDVSGGDYGGAQDFDVTVTVTDDDTAGLVLAPATLTVAENAAGSYTVALATKPSGAVAVTVTAPAGLEVDGPDAATSFTSGETLAFSTTNWKDPQTVRVRAPDDEVDQGTGRDLDIAHAAAGADYGSVSRNLAVTVTDDDARGVSVAPSSKALTLRETDDAATEDNTENVASYTVVLDSQPTADVTVAITAPLDAAATADPATLTFTPSDWDEPQTVTVTAVDDDADNAGGQRTATLSHDVSGGDYGGAQDFDVTVTVTDDDTAGLVLAPATLTVAENAAGSYTVALATKPSGAVAVTVTAPAGLEVDGPDAATSFTSGETLAFSTTNWKDPQTVRVRAPDDEVDQGTGRDLDIAHAAAGADYGSVSRNLAVTVTDDDARGVSVAPSSKALTLRETDDAATEDNTENVASYTVVLDSQPTADVTVAITAPLDAAATADPATLTFTPSDWDEPQTVTVTAVDDDADNAGGQRTATLSHDVSGGDYGGAQDFDVTVTVTDDDTAGLVLAPATLTVAENAAGSYTVALATKPSGAVAVTVTAPAGLEVDGPDAATSFTSGETLAFSTTNWKDPQTVRVRAPDDEVDQGTGRDLDIAHAAAGADYGSVSRNLAVTVTDDDARGVSVAPSSKALTLRETDDAATEDNTENVASYTVVLDSQPTADVTVAITAPLDAAATADPATLTFTPSDWDEPQTVTVTAVDDDADNAGGQRTATLSHDVSGGDYGGAQDFDVTVTVTDDDTAGLVLAPATLTVAENAAGSYTVALATKPSGAVAVTVTAPAGLEVDGPDAATSFTSGETLAFSTTNWKDPQTVRVRAPDDEVDQGTGRDLDIAHAAAGADYGSVSRNLAVTVTDDDARGVSVAPSSKALTLRETDDAATEDNTENVASYTVVLDSQPTADVTVAITAPLDAAATADPATLTFTPSDWDEPQTVTVTAVDDDADNAGGQRTATLSHDVSGGDYGGAQDFDVTVTVTDDDTAGLVLAPATLTVAENAAGSYTVALATKPSGAVAVTVTAPAGLEVDGPDAATSFTSGETLAFSTTNWKDPQTVRVRAPDDEVDQGTGRDLDIAHAAAGADYGSVSRNLAVTVTDDDARGVSVAPSSKALTLRETDDAATEDNTENVASYTVVLDSQPTADVTVAITAPLDAAATADPATLTFTPSDWDEPQTVTVTAVDDDADNAGGQRTATLSHDVSGGDYGGAQDFDVTVTVTDDDTAGLVLAPATLTVAENAAGSYTVALATKPSGAVAVTVTAPAGLEVDGPDAATSFTSGETLAFSTTNWKDPQTVRVRAPDDEVDQGTGRDLDIAHAAAGADYGSVSRNLAVTVTDDDARGVSVAPSSKALTLRETDDAATEDNTENVASYTVVLDSQPTADVTVAITAPLDAAATADPATLTFTPSDWDEPQTVTVTAVDDDADNAGGQRTATLSHDVSGGDYGGAQDFDVTVTVTDDDTAGLVLAPATLTVAENAAGSYTVALATKPSGAVAVTVTAPAGLEVDGPDAATSFTSGETLAFSTTNWKDPQTVRVRAPDDEVDQGTGRDLDIAHAAAGADYGSVSRNLAVTVTDDDATAVTLAVPDATATEGSVSDVARITLTLGRSLVSGESLGIPLAFAGGAAGTDFELALPDPAPKGVTLSGTMVTFTGPSAAAAEVRLAAKADADTTDDAVTVSIPASSTGNAPVLGATGLSGGAAGSRTGSGVITLKDSAAGGLVLSTSTLEIPEGASRSYTVRLATEPSGTVTVTVSGHAGTGLTLDETSLTFTPSDWDDEQIVTVTAPADNDDAPRVRTQTADTGTTLMHAAAGGGYDGHWASLQVMTLDGRILISIADAEGPEGSWLEFPVTLSRPSPGDVRVRASTHWSVAHADKDFVDVTETLHFAKGEDEKTVRVWVKKDDIFDPHETFEVFLTFPSGADFAHPVLTVPEEHRHEKSARTWYSAVAYGTIIDPVPAPPPLELTITSEKSSWNEGSEVLVTVWASARNEINRAIRVPLDYSGTAEEGDYEGPTGIWLYPGWKQSSAEIAVFHDRDTDDETLTVSIGKLKPLEAVPGDDDSVEFAIIDDGGAEDLRGLDVVLAVDTDVVADGAQDSVAEEGGVRTVRVTAALDGATRFAKARHPFLTTRFAEDRTVSVSIGNPSDSATEGADYEAVAGFSIVIPARETEGSATFTLTPTDDALAELKESISVEGTLGNVTAKPAAVAIDDDDAATLSINDVTVAEGSVARFTVSLSRVHASDMTVTVTTADGTAKAPSDYTHHTRTLTIPAGDRSATFDVQTHADTVAELDETFTVTLASGSVPISNETGTGTIAGASSLFSVSNAEADEGDRVTFTITRRGDTSTASSVRWTTGDNASEDGHPATAGVDYTAVDTARKANFDAGVAETTVTVQTLDDAVVEPDETFLVVLTDPTDGDAISGAAAIGTIRDDDGGRSLVVSASTLEVKEGGSAAYTVKLASQPSGTVTVTVTGHEGTVLTLGPASLEFTAKNWNAAQTVTVTAGQDGDASRESVVLRHAAAGGGFDAATFDVTVEVADDDTPGLILSVTELEIPERTVRSYAIRLGTEPTGTVTVTVSGHAGTDLTLDATTLEFTPSDWEEDRTVTVVAVPRVPPDEDTDQDEDNGDPVIRSMTLTHTASGGGYDGLEADLDVTVRAPITISIADAEGPEGSRLEFRVTLSRPSPGDVAVNWGTHPQIAKSGLDFVADSGRLHFAEDEQEKVIGVWAEEDSLDDPNEVFTVDLWNPAGAEFETPVTVVPLSYHFDLETGTAVEVIQATGTILGPAPPLLELSISSSDSFVDEGGKAKVKVTATAANALERPVRVPLVYARGTAEEGDFGGEPGIWIQPGRTQGSVEVTAFHDEDADDETFTVSIGELRPLEAVAGDDDSVEVTILDDDGAGTAERITVSVHDAEAVEGEEDLRFLVTLSRAANSPVTVQAETWAGTASANRDYIHGFGEVRFEPGQRTRAFMVWVLDDDIDEGVETLTLEISDPDPSGVMIARAAATGSIRNSDAIPAAWLARFGRTLAQQTIDAIAGRMKALREPGFRGSVPMLGLTADSGGAGDRPGSPDAVRGRLPGPAEGSEPSGGSRRPGGLRRTVSSGIAGEAGPAAGPWPAGGPGRPGGAEDGTASTSGLGVPGGCHTGTDPGSGRTEEAWPSAQDPADGICGEWTSVGEFLVEAFSGVSFTWTGEAGPSGGSVAWWGGGERSSFSGGDGSLGLEGEIVTGRLGVDYARDGWLAGVVLAHSVAEGEWSGGERDGTLEASLTSWLPYVATSLSGRLEMWSVAGAGRGTLKLAHGSGDGRAERLKTGLRWRMAAAGLRGDLLETPAEGPSLALISDALWVRTSSEKARGLAASESDVTRLRVGLEGSWGLTLSGGGISGSGGAGPDLRAGGGSLTPKLELGVRHDGGDAETGFGVELGGGLVWTDLTLGLTLDLSGRTLLAHGDDDLKDRGYAASLAYDPRPATQRGLSLTLRQDWGGRASGGLDALFAPEPLARIGSGGGGEAASRWEAEAAYGLPILGGRFTGSPHAGLGLATGARDYSLGWRLTPEAANAPNLSFGLKATRRESDATAPEHTVGVEFSASW